MTVFVAFINLLVIGAVAFLIWRRQPLPAMKVFWPALIVKLTAGVCLGMIYYYYYQGEGDTVLYFKDSGRIAALARADLLSYFDFLWYNRIDIKLISDVASQPRTLYMLKLASVFNLLSHDNYWITASYFSFVSFVSAWYLVNQVSRTLPLAYWPAVAGFLFFPSAVFWSSGLIKESLAMAGIYFLAGCFLRAWFSLRIRLWEIVTVPIAAWIVWSLKYYFLGVLAPVAIASLFVHRLYKMQLPVRSLTGKIMIWLAVVLVPLTAVFWLHPNFHPQVLMGVIVDNYLIFHSASQPEDVIYYTNLRPDITSLLMHTPKAVFSGLFRPLLWEASSGLQVLAAIENTMLVVLTLAATLNIRRLWESPYRLLIVTVLVYAAVLAAFLALSTPNFGTLSRYKVGFLPFFVTAVLIQNPLVIRMLRILQRYPGTLAS